MEARPHRLRGVVGVVSAMLLVGCAGDVATTATETTAVASTTSAVAEPSTTSTTRPSTTTSGVTTTTLGAGPSRFVPECVERDATAAVPDDPPTLDTLGPLGAEPVVQLQLPRIPAVEGTFANGDTVRAAALRIPGGMLVTMRPYDGIAEVGQLVAVDRTGAIRWQRCMSPMPTVVKVARDGRSTEMLLDWSTYHADGTFTARLEVWSLADGRRTHTWAEVLADSGLPPDTGDVDWALAEGPNVMVLGDDRVATAADPKGSLLRLDLRTMAVQRVPDPRVSVQGLPDALQLGVTGDDVVVAYSPTLGAPYRVGAVWTGDRWSDDPATIERSVPTWVQFVYEADRETLFGIDALGRTVWHRDDLLVVPGEGFRVAVDDGVAIALTCAAPLEPDGEWCPGAAIVGVDAATGRTLWQQDGRWTVAFVGDGLAMVAPLLPANGMNPPPTLVWRMIDVATGHPAAPRTWVHPRGFGTGCCDEPARLDVFGGVVFTWDAVTVEMWYPDAASTPLRAVSLG